MPCMHYNVTTVCHTRSLFLSSRSHLLLPTYRYRRIAYAYVYSHLVIEFRLGSCVCVWAVLLLLHRVKIVWKFRFWISSHSLPIIINISLRFLIVCTSVCVCVIERVVKSLISFSLSACIWEWNTFRWSNMMTIGTSYINSLMEVMAWHRLTHSVCLWFILMNWFTIYQRKNRARERDRIQHQRHQRMNEWMNGL